MNKMQEKIEKIDGSKLSTQDRIDAKLEILRKTINAYRSAWASIPERHRTVIKGCMSHDIAAIIEADESTMFLK